MIPAIPLHWIGGDLERAVDVFFPLKKDGKRYYLGAPLVTDFEQTVESLKPFLVAILDQTSLIEGCGLHVALVEIKAGVVSVF